MSADQPNDADFPSWELPPDATPEQVHRAMASAIFSIAANLRHLRHQESGNSLAIKLLERRVEQLERAVLP
jgi:hypothetical protein